MGASSALSSMQEEAMHKYILCRKGMLGNLDGPFVNIERAPKAETVSCDYFVFKITVCIGWISRRMRMEPM